MKRFIILVAIFLAFGVNVRSQNLDREKTKVTYTQLPLTPLPEDIAGYHVEINRSYIYAGDNVSEVENKLKAASKIPHLKQTMSNGIKLKVRLESYYKSEVKYLTAVHTEKRDDKEVSVTYYYLTFEYKYPLYYEIYLPDEFDALHQEFVNGSQSMQYYKSNEFRSESDLNKWWNDNYKTVQAKLRRTLLNNHTGALKARLTSLYSYGTSNLYTTFYTVKKFKSYDYDDLTNAWLKAKEAQSLVAATDIIFSDDFNNTMSEAIDIWFKALEESDLDAKKTRVNKKVTEAIYNNIYLAYTMMSEFDKADGIRTEAEQKIKKNAIDYASKSFYDGRTKRFEANAGNIPASKTLLTSN